MNLADELRREAPRKFIRGRFVEGWLVGGVERGNEYVAKFDETGARVAWVIGASDAALERGTEREWRAFEPHYRAWWAETQAPDVRGVDTHVEGRAEVLEEQVKNPADEAYQRGYNTADLLSNPYPEDSTEARHFVDGWVAGRKWEKPAMPTEPLNPEEK